PRKSAEAKHVQSGSNMGIDIKYSCFINGEHVATTKTSCMYYSPAQLVAHHTVAGAPLRNGDLLASGTISVPGPDELGCLLEQTEGGKKPVVLGEGKMERVWWEDGDGVRFVAGGGGEGKGVGFGECKGRIVGRETFLR